MSNVKRVSTSAEVWAVIRARHREMTPFSSFSNPDGLFLAGDGRHGEMWTQYGFPGCAWPLLEARTTWDIDPEEPHTRLNERHEYWLLTPEADE